MSMSITAMAMNSGPALSIALSTSFAMSDLVCVQRLLEIKHHQPSPATPEIRVPQMLGITKATIMVKDGDQKEYVGGPARLESIL